MTQHINIIRKNACIFILIIFYACSGNESFKQNTKVINTAQNDVSTKKYLKETLTFIGSRIDLSKTQKKEYSEQQAQEILKHLKISMSPDSVYIGSFCKYKFFKETYNESKMKYRTESLIVNEFGFSDKNIITCISNYDGTNKGCLIPYSKLIKSDDKVIYFDGGYFFSFKQERSHVDSSYKIKGMAGVIGDTRQEWKVSYTYSNNLSNTYKDFLSRFPFGSQFMEKNIILKNQFDSINDIQYTFHSNLIEIKKNISVGSLYAKFKFISPSLTEVEYYLSFPFENSNYDG